MKKKIVSIVLILGIIITVIGFLLLSKNNIIRSSSKIQIIDATYSCSTAAETFYEDDEYIYSFPCVKSSSIFVKFENGNKMLVVDALEQSKVTIDELLDAGLEVYKNKK